MLLISIALCVLVVLNAISVLRIQRLSNEMRRLKKELEMWKLAADRMARDNERMSRELMS